MEISGRSTVQICNNSGSAFSLLRNNFHLTMHFTLVCKKFFIFSRAVLCCLTWNSLGTEVSCVRRADNMRMTRGWHKSETSLEIWAGGWHMSSAHHLHVIRRWVCHPHVICRWVRHPHVIYSTTHDHRGPKLSFYSDRNWLLNGICHKNVEFFYFRIM